MTTPVSEFIDRFELLDEAGGPLDLSMLPGRHAMQGRDAGELEVGWRSVATGEVHWSVVKATPVWGEDGRVQFAVNIFRDITERKHAEQALKASKRETEAARRNLHNLFMEAPALIGILRGREGVVELLNPHFSKMWPNRGVIGKPMREVFHELEGQGWIELVEQVYDTGETVYGTERKAIIDVDGDGEMEEHFFNFIYQATRNADGEIDGVAIYGVEVTEQVVARNRAEEAVRLRDEFLSIASHELKTPITSIKGYSQVLSREIAQYSGASDRAVRIPQIIISQADRLTALVNEMLDVARIEQGQLQLSPESVDLVELAREVIAHMRILSEQHRIEVKSDEEMLCVDADRERVGQVLVNLLENGIKYSPGAGPIEVRVSKEEGRAVVSVKDSGIGILAEELGQVFERFYRGPNSPARNFGGLGLGLYISREIVQRHGGEMWVESEPDTGSTFHFSLPLSRTED